MSEKQSRYRFRLVSEDERQAVIDFVNQNFGARLPLVNRRDLFEYYYHPADTLQFAVAEQDGQYAAVVGYILANRAAQPDVWVSVWASAKGQGSVGLQLMDALPRLLGARLVACNNIRQKTCVLYHFLGWTATRLPHYFRLAARDSLADYRLCRPALPADAAPDQCLPVRLPCGGDLTLTRVADAAQLAQLGLPPTPHTPRKDIWYLTRRYFQNPHLTYNVYAACVDERPLCYLVTRTVPSGEDGDIPVLRILDFIGEDSVLPRIGAALDRLLQQCGAEYADCYCAGIPAAVFAAAGFTERLPQDGNIIPNYLTPPLYENTEYYYFTNEPENFVLFKADGDQDRANLSIED